MHEAGYYFVALAFGYRINFRFGWGMFMEDTCSARPLVYALHQKIKQAKFDMPVWQRAAQIYASLSQQGNLIDDADIFIAAFCLVNDCTLVTNNTRHFKHIIGLNFVNWKQ